MSKKTVYVNASFNSKPDNQQPVYQQSTYQPQVVIHQQSSAQNTTIIIQQQTFFFPEPELSGVNTARSRLESFQLQTSHMEKSIKSMLETIKEVSTFYIQFTQKILDPWFSDAPPKVAAADELLKFNGPEFDSFVDKLTNQLGPSFFNVLKKHDSTLKELLSLEKKCSSALKDYEKKEIAYKAEVSAISFNKNKIENAKDAYIKSRKELDQINSKFINEVYSIDIGRQCDLTNAFKSFYGMLCQFINKASKLKPIDFPTNLKDYFIDPEPPYVPITPSSSSNATIGQQPSQDLPSDPDQIPPSPYTNPTSSSNPL